MEKYIVIGYFANSFNDKEGKNVSYAKLFLNPVAKPDKGVITGELIETYSVKPELLSNVIIGSTISLFFNKYGKVQDIVEVEA